MNSWISYIRLQHLAQWLCTDPKCGDKRAGRHVGKAWAWICTSMNQSYVVKTSAPLFHIQASGFSSHAVIVQWLCTDPTFQTFRSSRSTTIWSKHWGVWNCAERKRPFDVSQGSRLWAPRFSCGLPQAFAEHESSQQSLADSIPWCDLRAIFLCVEPAPNLQTSEVRTWLHLPWAMPCHMAQPSCFALLGGQGPSEVHQSAVGALMVSHPKAWLLVQNAWTRHPAIPHRRPGQSWPIDASLPCLLFFGK